MIADPLHRNDCCIVTDSGGAFVLASRRRAEQLAAKALYLLGVGEALGQISMSQMWPFTETAAVGSGARALASAGMTHDEIDCAQLYDSFTITVLLTLESLGFCGRGEGGAFVDSGALAPSGALPINTDGGGLSSNHPGRRGALCMIEGVRQLRGESPGVRLDGARSCLVHGTRGSASGCTAPPPAWCTARAEACGPPRPRSWGCDVDAPPKPRPQTDGLSGEFWAAAREGRLLIQRCADCGEHQGYPRAHCLRCGGAPAWLEASGRGVVHTFTVVRRSTNP